MQIDCTERSRYRGSVKALILDWSGTVADAYVIAPAIVFVEVFARQGVAISMEEAREPMGLRKDLHIQALIETSVIRERWKQVKGQFPGAEDVAAMYADFVPLQLECLRDYAALLPGVVQTSQHLQARGIKLGSTTGFTRVMIDVLLEQAQKQGFCPDATVGGDEVTHGTRPAPFMLYRNLEILNVHPIESVIKVDDTAGGVAEGLLAGCWTVGIARYSNYMNIDTLEQAETICPTDLKLRLEQSRQRLRQSGAHYVIDQFPQLLDVVDDMECRLANGEKP